MTIVMDKNLTNQNLKVTTGKKKETQWSIANKFKNVKKQRDNASSSIKTCPTSSLTTRDQNLTLPPATLPTRQTHLRVSSKLAAKEASHKNELKFKNTMQRRYPRDTAKTYTRVNYILSSFINYKFFESKFWIIIEFCWVVRPSY